MRRQLSIGIFDSGVGGLTVLQALLRRLPAESYNFLGDTARLPYGTKGRDTIVEYSLRASRKLLEKAPAKMLVVACNTASSVALPALEREFPDIPVVGVIESGARAAALASRSGHIAVLATEATTRGGAYVRAIRRLRPEARVTGRACTLFVPLAEEGWLEGEVADGMARRYLGELFSGPGAPDTVLLGCTPYPLLRGPIASAAGEGVRVVDSAQTTAEAVAALLQKRGLAAEGPGPGSVHFMATDNAARFAATGGLFLGRPLSEGDVELVDL